MGKQCNNKNKLINLSQSEDYFNIEDKACYDVKISNSIFNGFDSIASIYYGNVTFENDIFTNANLSKELETTALKMDESLILTSYKPINNIYVNNCIFTQLYTYSFPLFTIYSSKLNIKNTKFNSCVSSTNYLINISKNENYEPLEINDSFFQSNSVVIGGTKNNINLNNTIIQKPKITNTPSVIFDTTDSHYTISNSKFRFLNLTKTSKLMFNSLNDFSILNTQFLNLTSDYDYMIKCLYHDLAMIDVVISYALNQSSSPKSSIIFYDSGDEKRKLIINNVIFAYCIVSDSIMKITGNDTKIYLNSLKLYENTIGGALIKFEPQYSEISITNIEVKNCKNNRDNHGIFSFANNVNITISNSHFLYNKSDYGGTLYFKDIKNLNLNIVNTFFIENNSKYGGAIYLSMNDYEDIDYRSISLHNVTFQNNVATYFGGAIYFKNSLNYLKSMTGSVFKNNTADIAGGAIFTTNESINTLIFSNLDAFVNNTSKAYGKNYASFPSLALPINKTGNFKISSGNSVSISYIVKDIYGQQIRDTPKLHSNFQLVAELFEISKYDIGDTNGYIKPFYILENHIKTFNNGECIFNDLKIYANPKDYIIHFSMENDPYNITFAINDIPITIKDCENTEIKNNKTYNNYNITYCEKPKCKNGCVNGICMPPIDNHTNNYCKCYAGFDGITCNNVSYESLSNMLTRTRTMQYTIVGLETSIFIFSIYLKNNKVIAEIGYYKLLLLHIALICITVSVVFDGHNDNFMNFLNSISRHTGLFILISVFHCIINISRKLGIPNKDYEIKMLEIRTVDLTKHSKISFSFGSKKSKRSKIRFLNHKGNERKKIAKTSYIPRYNNKSCEFYTNYDNDRENSFTLNKNGSISNDFLVYENLFKRIKEIYENNFKIMFLCVFCITVLIILGINSVIEYNKDIYKNSSIFNNEAYFRKTHVISTNKKWMCINPLSRLNTAFHFAEYLYLIYFITKSSFIWKYEGIFKINIKIYYSVILLLTIGIPPNIISDLVLTNNPNRIPFLLIISNICYSMIYIMVIFDFLYVAFKKNVKISDYFICPKMNFCFFHRSYICGCLKDESEKDEIENLKKFLFLYKYFSVMFEIQNKKIKLVNTNQRIAYIQTLY
ncbi:hypothetical protein BCR36DRAFT_415820 [Piromyces finnis]|uniref:EGF-like domain-containing protein n=1 Tax=Piromyces finnis TaxID=1754191 RepID=A0A1Y1UXS4_9FUNG|nr:hypothetical protein BCR36DRAFT_415820 [Piromyces finnis]|eukprot:ORX42971.1 hypothetical protein BCR36DRAFT_415820 [Piromyces finnis]